MRQAERNQGRRPGTTTIVGLYKAEFIHRRSWRNLQAVGLWRPSNGWTGSTALCFNDRAALLVTVRDSWAGFAPHSPGYVLAPF